MAFVDILTVELALLSFFVSVFGLIGLAFVKWVKGVAKGINESVEDKFALRDHRIEVLESDKFDPAPILVSMEGLKAEITKANKTLEKHVDDGRSVHKDISDMKVEQAKMGVSLKNVESDIQELKGR